MKALFLFLLTSLVSISVQAQGYDISEAHEAEVRFKQYKELCESQEDFYSAQSTELNNRMDQFMAEATDELDGLLSIIKKVEEGLSKDVAEYCDPSAHENLIEIVNNYRSVNSTAESFRQKANKMSDTVRNIGTLLGDDIWSRVKDGDSSVSKKDLPKLNLVTPREVPIIYIQKDVLTALVFSTSIEKVTTSYAFWDSYDDNILFLNIADPDLELKASNIVVKLKNGDVYPIKVKLADDENEADLLVEIKLDSKS